MNFLNKVKNLFFGGESPDDDDDARRQRRQDGEGAGPSTAAPKRPRSSRASPDKPAASAACPTEREPVLRDAGFADKGGVQGLDWYAASQLQDQHGDFANGFFDADEGSKRGGKPKKGAHRAPKLSAGCGPAATKQLAPRPSQLKVKDVHLGAVILEPV